MEGIKRPRIPWEDCFFFYIYEFDLQFLHGVNFVQKLSTKSFSIFLQNGEHIHHRF